MSTWAEVKPPSTSTVTMPVASEQDLLRVRAALRSAAEQAGFGLVAATKLVTAGSELARNILRYADGDGTVHINTEDKGPLRGIRATFVDSGPGIPDLEAAMRDGFTTAGGLGLGLPGAMRLVDEFVIESGPGSGTRVVIAQWTRLGSPATAGSRCPAARIQARCGERSPVRPSSTAPRRRRPREPNSWAPNWPLTCDSTPNQAAMSSPECCRGNASN